jgi:hypothetical protein
MAFAQQPPFEELAKLFENDPVSRRPRVCIAFLTFIHLVGGIRDAGLIRTEPGRITTNELSSRGPCASTNSVIALASLPRAVAGKRMRTTPGELAWAEKRQLAKVFVFRSARCDLQI